MNKLDVGAIKRENIDSSMNSVAPILLFGAGLVLVSKSRKKKKRVSENVPIDLSALPDASASETKVVSTWAQRQQAMKFLAEHDVCESDPGAVDGKFGPATKAAVKAFQACVDIPTDGLWGEQTERAMLELLRKLERDGLPVPKPGPTPTPSPTPNQKWTPDDVIVMDPQCNQMLHIDNSLFDKQRRRAAEYALDGNTAFVDAQSIHQEMVEEYAPLCASLGRQGVGAGVRTWWDENIKWIYNVLREYEILPDALEEDAQSFGIL